MRRRTLLVLSVFVVLSGCGRSVPDVGDIQLENERVEFFTGDVLRLRWNAAHAERVYINAVTEEGAAQSFNPEGYPPIGNASVRVDENTFALKGGKPLNIRFALLAQNPRDADKQVMLDITQNIEIKLGAAKPDDNL